MLCLKEQAGKGRMKNERVGSQEDICTVCGPRLTCPYDDASWLGCMSGELQTWTGRWQAGIKERGLKVESLDPVKQLQQRLRNEEDTLGADTGAALCRAADEASPGRPASWGSRRVSRREHRRHSHAVHSNLATQQDGNDGVLVCTRGITR